MPLLENLKKTLKDGTEKVVKKAEDITDKIKDVGEEGIELSKEVIAEISEKTSDITKIARYKLELNEIQKKINRELMKLGELVFASYLSKKKDKNEEKINKQIENIEILKKDMLRKTTKHDSLRKSYSQNYVVQKFSDELAESDAANKSLKELTLPKEALISAIKRNDQVIIPDGHTKILVDDLVTIIGKRNDVNKVKKKIS